MTDSLQPYNPATRNRRVAALFNKTALSNPLPLRTRSRWIVRNLNQDRRGAPSSGCQASDVDMVVGLSMGKGSLFSVIVQ